MKHKQFTIRVFHPLIVVMMLLSGCATKEFAKLPDIAPQAIVNMSCEDIDREFYRLEQHEAGVDDEATQGQAKQIFWGGIWSVMADEKLEAVARKDIRKRLKLLYDLKIKKGCQ